MARRLQILTIAGIMASLVAIGAFARAQSPKLPGTEPVPPTILSGSDLGFRVEGRKGQTAVGTIVVRMNGQWVEAELGGGGIHRLTTP